MFKKDINLGAKSKVKSSAQRALRTKIQDTYAPLLTPAILDEMIPKKSQIDAVKLPDRVTLYGLDDQALFYQHMNGPLIPTLRLVHRFPSAFRTIQIDRGAIRFVLSGATLMVPGLTSPGGRLPPSPSSEKQDKPQRRKGENDDDDDEAEATDAPLAAGAVVVVMAEGKQEACMVGELKMGTEEMKKVGKGVAIDNGHFLGDGLWRIRID